MQGENAYSVCSTYKIHKLHRKLILKFDNLLLFVRSNFILIKIPSRNTKLRSISVWHLALTISYLFLSLGAPTGS
jgi:hypothetical protein